MGMMRSEGVMGVTCYVCLFFFWAGWFTLINWQRRRWDYHVEMRIRFRSKFHHKMRQPTCLTYISKRVLVAE